MNRSRTKLLAEKYEVVKQAILGVLTEPEYQDGISIERISKKTSDELELDFFTSTEIREYVRAILFDLRAEGVIEDVPETNSHEIRLKAKGRDALIEAARRGHTTVIKRLLFEGVDADSQNAALVSAVINNRVEAVKLLIKAGADVNAREELFDRTPLMYARSKAGQEVVKLLKGAGAVE